MLKLPPGAPSAVRMRRCAVRAVRGNCIVIGAGGRGIRRREPDGRRGGISGWDLEGMVGTGRGSEVNGWIELI